MLRGERLLLGAGDHAPTLLIWTGDTLEVVIIPFTDDRMKVFTAMLMREAASQGKAEEIVIVTEAWVTIHPIGDETVGKVLPRDNPARQECIIVEYSRPQIAWSAMAMIDRPTGGKPRLLDWQTMNSEVGTLTGRFSNVWQPNTADETIATARAGS